MQRNGKERIAFFLDVDVAERFRAAARLKDGGMSQALVRMIGSEIGDEKAVAPRALGTGDAVMIRLKGTERYALNRTADAAGMTPAAWVRSLALVHLTKKPEWNPEDREALRAIGRELRKIGTNVNQIAHAANAAAQVGLCPPGQGDAALQAAELIGFEMRRLAGVVTGNFDYWGLPDEERPTAKRGALGRLKVQEDRVASQRKAKLKVRPRKFATGKGNRRD